uniref:Uncharacterized protein n=1 Tax=Mycena chlorophos TaxID=658473 RepID=A0ABQ0L8T2_MYCCL|nr:predicted protein [Mycena chlorophos]
MTPHGTCLSFKADRVKCERQRGCLRRRAGLGAGQTPMTILGERQKCVAAADSHIEWKADERLPGRS